MKLAENEKRAVISLKKALEGKLRLLDFRIFGSRARGDALPDSDIDIMIEIEEYSPSIESAIDDLVYETNLAHDCFISTVIFSKKELDDGPFDESPLYKAIEREGIRV